MIIWGAKRGAYELRCQNLTNEIKKNLKNCKTLLSYAFIYIKNISKTYWFVLFEIILNI